MVVAATMPGATLSARLPPQHGYVTSVIQIPTSPQQVNAFGRDINGDGRVDNALGQFFAALEAQNLDFEGDTTTAIDGGQLLMLHALRTPSFKKTKKATWQVLYAKPTAAPKFDGNDKLTVDGSAPSSIRLRATILRNRVRTAAGTIPVELDLGGILVLHLQKGVIFATCSQTTCSNGRITGVVTKGDLDNLLIPQLAVLFSAAVAHDCPGPGPESCTNGSTGQTLQELFDANDDLVITSAELSQNSFFEALLAPDIDLNHDGKPDAISVGFGFDTVRAKIVR